MNEGWIENTWGQTHTHPPLPQSHSRVVYQMPSFLRQERETQRACVHVHLKDPSALTNHTEWAAALAKLYIITATHKRMHTLRTVLIPHTIGSSSMLRMFLCCVFVMHRCKVLPTGNETALLVFAWERWLAAEDTLYGTTQQLQGRKLIPHSVVQHNSYRKKTNTTLCGTTQQSQGRKLLPLYDTTQQLQGRRLLPPSHHKNSMVQHNSFNEENYYHSLVQHNSFKEEN